MAARKKPPAPEPDVSAEQIVEAAIAHDERIRERAATLVNRAIDHAERVLISGSPERQDKVAQTYVTQVVKSLLDRGPQADATVEEFHALRRSAGLASLSDDDG